MDNLLLHKFYAASISIDRDGSMLVASTGERSMAWAMVFCFIAAAALSVLLIIRKKSARKISIAILCISLIIPAIIIPSNRNEQIHVSKDQITIYSGQWFSPSITVVTLNELYNLRRVHDDYMISNIIGDAYVTWFFERRDGSVQELVLNDFFTAHSMTVAHYIRDRGHPVEWLYNRF